MQPVIDLAALKNVCSNCSLRELCLPVGVTREQLESLDELVYARRRLRRGACLFRAGDAFRHLYAIRSGFFKTRVSTGDGRDQVTGFLMAGELLGIDGIAAERHSCDAVALEDSEICVIPYGRLAEVSQRFEPLQRHFNRVLSREIVRDQDAMLTLGSRRAEERVASFLVRLSERFAARGCSASDYVLRMTRADIGSFLGLTLETVSRLLSRFREEGLISVHGKHIGITDLEGLRALAR